jgi:hypothetical protein
MMNLDEVEVRHEVEREGLAYGLAVLGYFELGLFLT